MFRRFRAALLAAPLLTLLLSGCSGEPQNQPTVSPEDLTRFTPEPVFYSPLTGVEVADAATATKPVLAAMVENLPYSRPQSGLMDAGVVFEAIAEAGITRFVVLYQEAEPALIGPIRSARQYFIEWMHGFDAALARCGGSKEARQAMESGAYGVDLDEITNSASAYWRESAKEAPHNMYTDYAHLKALLDKRNKITSTFTPWPRQDGAPASNPTATVIDLDISYDEYLNHYEWDAASNTYLRWHGSEPHLDREQGQLHPAVVIGLRVAEWTVNEGDGNRQRITTSGSGSAYIFQNGTVTEATWIKDSSAEMLRFVDAAGADIPLNRGQVWITAVPNENAITWR
ncbi:MAG: DUF3048 domain-containing protein [Propionibacteriaceae bacterium]|nr:DUF3048 domain-containing protein [Propionibacteriaceae bacterium]